MFCRTDDPPDPEGTRCLQRHHHQVTKSDRVHEVPDLARIIRDGIRRRIRIGRPQHHRQVLAAHPDGRPGNSGQPIPTTSSDSNQGRYLSSRLPGPPRPSRHLPRFDHATNTDSKRNLLPQHSTKSPSAGCSELLTHRRRIPLTSDGAAQEMPTTRSSRTGSSPPGLGHARMTPGPIEPAEVILEIDMQPFSARHPGLLPRRC